MISRLEDFLGTRLEGIFRRAFPRPLEPSDLARALHKQMLKQRLKSIKYTYVPNFYLIRLHPRDYQNFAPYQHSLLGELAEYLEKKAKERNLYLIQPLEIKLDCDPHIAQGKIKVFGRLQEGLGGLEKNNSGEEIDEDTRIYQRGWLNREAGLDTSRWLVEVVEGVDKGKTIALSKYRNIIGRNPSADINLLDPAVSRYHAQLELLGQQVLLTDLGSTNGTVYRGQPVDSVLLEAGEEFQVGNSRIVLREYSHD